MSLATKQFEWTFELVIAIFVTAVLIIGGWLVYGWYTGSKVNAATVTEQAATANATAEVGEELGAAQETAAQDTQVANTSRRSYANQYQAAAAADPRVNDWGRTRIPDSVRDAARKSRQARDRLTDAPAGSSLADGTAAPSW